MATETERKGAAEREAESRRVAEGAREAKWVGESFMRHLFEGRFRLDLIHPYPEPDPEEEARGRQFLDELRAFSLAHIDGDRIDREGHVPEEVLDGLRELGAFGIQIPREYGGLGFSQLTYNRALSIVSARCGATGAFLSAHQSIGVPKPLSLFGTGEQKKKYLPRLAAGALSAFALTEAEVGSDPANMSTTATPSEDGESWILNGEKLWCTNGPRAEIMVVMARTPPREGIASERPITAFIVETAWDGVEVVHESRFMGIRGISNGVIRFNDVRVPAENVIWGEGQGLKLALITLNTGRLSLPAFCTASGKGALELTRRWAAERVQWGQAIGKHDAVAQKLGRIATHTFAMEAGAELACALADRGVLDIRLEAALVKLWHTETAWELANDALQIRGGRGYETADSLRERGETPYPVERNLRDLRINLIFEGSSEIMRLFIAREAVDTHLKIAGDLVDSKAPTGKRVAAAVRSGLHYAWWYPTRWVGWSYPPRYAEFDRLARHLRYVDRTSRRLARGLFHSMVRFGPRLEKKQAVLGRLVDIGAECFLITASCVSAHRLVQANPDDRSAEELADAFSRQARRRIEARFSALFRNDDEVTYGIARGAMDGRYAWLSEEFAEFVANPPTEPGGSGTRTGSGAGAGHSAGEGRGAGALSG